MKLGVLLAPVVLATCVGFTAAQADDAAPKDKASAVEYLQTLVKFMGDDDPRLRLSVREALVVMGTQAVGAINTAKTAAPNDHVRKFMDRTVKRIKDRAATTRNQSNGRNDRGGRRGGGRGGRNMFGANTVDIDRLAADANLNWEQMNKVEPVIKKVRKDMGDLWQEFRESGAMRDREAWQDLREEMEAISKDAEPALKEFLDTKQMKQVKRYLTGGNRMMGRRGGGGRERGGRGGRERP